MAEKVLMKGNEAMAEAAIRAAITIQGSPVPPAPLCYAIITREGVQRLA